MRLSRLALLLLLAALVAPATVSTEPSTRDTRMLAQPATNGTHVAFVYADDLWVAKLDGTDVRRLTTDDGVESRPAFSPDGTLIAFSAQYDGNIDVFVVPAEGGVPRRLTWHPGPDLVQGFAVDGTRVLFTSGRAAFTGAYQHLFTVPIEGGVEEQLPIPNAYQATYSPDGRRIAYNPLPPAFDQWKQYRGGRVSRLWLYSSARPRDREGAAAGRSRRTTWTRCGSANTVYFRSDRDGEFNVYAYDTSSKQVRRITKHDDFPGAEGVGGRREDRVRAGRLPAPARPGQRVGEAARDSVSADLRETRPRFVKGPEYIRSVGISPSGARAVFEFRGEIVTVPAEKGDVRNLTASPGAHERSPEWSPDGSRIAYFSDASGEYELHVAPQDGKGDVKKYKLAGAGFYSDLRWSPDSLKIAFVDNSQSRVLPGPGDRRGEARRRQPGLHADQSDQRRLVARFEVDRLRRRHPAAREHGVRVLAGPGQVVSHHRRLERGDRAGVRQGRQVPLPVRFHRRRPGAGLVRAVERRHAAHAQRVPGRAAQGHRVAAREGERRGEAEEGRRARGEGRRQDAARRGGRDRSPRPRRRSRSRSTSTASRTASSRCPFPPAISSASRRATRGTSTTCAARAGTPRSTTTTWRSERTRRRSRRPTPTRSRPTGRRCCTPRTAPASSRRWGRRSRPARDASPRPTSRSASIRAPSGRRSSTRPGGSTATTSTRPTCTASTGRR